jgi:hypothetical protein
MEILFSSASKAENLRSHLAEALAGYTWLVDVSAGRRTGRIRIA